jgi:uncharacterized oligopeptide transporter (OPT) family protein
VHLSTGSLLLWTLSVAFFGVFFAVPLRRQVLLRERLRFPSGAATAELIHVLHPRGAGPAPTNVTDLVSACMAGSLPAS